MSVQNKSCGMCMSVKNDSGWKESLKAHLNELRSLSNSVKTKPILPLQLQPHHQQMLDFADLLNVDLCAEVSGVAADCETLLSITPKWSIAPWRSASWCLKCILHRYNRLFKSHRNNQKYILLCKTFVLDCSPHAQHRYRLAQVVLLLLFFSDLFLRFQ